MYFLVTFLTLTFKVLFSTFLHVHNCGVTHSSMGNQPVGIFPMKEKCHLYFLLCSSWADEISWLQADECVSQDREERHVGNPFLDG